jgi:hypothetical protein
LVWLPVRQQEGQLGEPLALPQVQVLQLELLVQQEVLTVLLQLAQLVRHQIHRK